MNRPSLNFSEWFVVLFFGCMMGVMLTVAKISKARAVSTLEKMKELPLVTVTVEGEVKKNGPHLVESGTTYRELFHSALPLPYADLGNFPLDKPILESIHITIPKLSKKIVILAVEGEPERPVEVSLDARIFDLKKQLSLILDAERLDLTSLKGRRKLKHLEKISIRKIILDEKKSPKKRNPCG